MVSHTVCLSRDLPEYIPCYISNTNVWISENILLGWGFVDACSVLTLFVLRTESRVHILDAGTGGDHSQILIDSRFWLSA
jgi:hypothetical protein